MSYSPAERTTQQLLADWAAVMRELRQRKVIRTNNNPVADLAEIVVEEHYGGQRSTSTIEQGWDVLDGADRIQVKGMRTTPSTKRRNTSPIGGSDYDVLIIVIFDEAFRVTDALRMERSLVENYFAPRAKGAHAGKRIATVTQRLLAHSEVEHVDMTDAARRLGLTDEDA